MIRRKQIAQQQGSALGNNPVTSLVNAVVNLVSGVISEQLVAQNVYTIAMKLNVRDVSQSLLVQKNHVSGENVDKKKEVNVGMS